MKNACLNKNSMSSFNVNSRFVLLDVMPHQHSKGYTATLPAFIGGGRHEIPLCVLFQAQSGTRVEPKGFHKLAG